VPACRRLHRVPQIELPVLVILDALQQVLARIDKMSSISEICACVLVCVRALERRLKANPAAHIPVELILATAITTARRAVIQRLGYDTNRQTKISPSIQSTCRHISVHAGAGHRATPPHHAAPE
jgi:hypothetical protein